MIATDSVGHSSRSKLVINIADINDEAPEWVSGTNATAEVHVKENWFSVGGKPAPIYRLAVSDADVDGTKHIRFHAIDKESSRLFLVSPSGGVYLRAPLDAERNRTHELKIQAFDGLNESREPFKLTVIVDDINDNNPICQEVCVALAISNGMFNGSGFQ